MAGVRTRRCYTLRRRVAIRNRSHGSGAEGVLDKTWKRLAVYPQLDRCEGAGSRDQLRTYQVEAPLPNSSYLCAGYARIASTIIAFLLAPAFPTVFVALYFLGYALSRNCIA